MHYAHSLPEEPEEKWQVLEDHLKQTAELAEVFAALISPGWGRILGWWHDAGKYQRAFQERIRQAADAHISEKVDHSTVGALIAKERQASMAIFAVAGHHGGLSNAETLGGRLKDKAHLLAVARRDGLPAWIGEQVVPAPPAWIVDRVSISLWTRFLFSALVDADFLDTERYTIPYALYRTHGFISPFLAKQTGFGEADYQVLMDALVHMFEHDRSAARGEMAVRGLGVFEHESALGNAPAHKLFESLRIEGPEIPRAFVDYRVAGPETLPAGVAFRWVVAPV